MKTTTPLHLDRTFHIAAETLVAIIAGGFLIKLLSILTALWIL